jgi:YHS domain-containing protein
MNLIVAIAVGLGVGSGPVKLVLKGLDPVMLASGQEVVGRSELTAAYLRHEYRFASSKNLAKFKANPVRYAVQNGGACGKMGALTGKGSPERWAVVHGKIFLFASDGCRTTFLENQGRYFSTAEAPIEATEADRQKAMALMERVVSAHGGRSAIRAAKQIEWTYDTPYREDGKDKIWHTRHALLGATQLAQWEEWDAGRVFFTVDGTLALEGKKGEAYGVHPGELRELNALFWRSPAGILLGLARPLKVLEGGRVLAMAREDVAFRIRLHPETSRIEAVLFRDRFSGPIQDVEMEYSDYATSSGIALPNRERVRLNGGEWKAPRTIASWSINGPRPVVFEEAGR